MRGTEVRKCDTCGLVLVAGGTYARAAYLQIKSSGFLLDDASRMVWSDVEPARCYAMRAADAPAFGDLLEAAE